MASMSPYNRRRVHIIVEGKVQGVGFRYHAHQTAQELGLSGWVKNLPDGTVEIAAEGESDKLQKLIDWAKKGPANARVTQVHARIIPALNEMADFQIR